MPLQVSEQLAAEILHVVGQHVLVLELLDEAFIQQPLEDSRDVGGTIPLERFALDIVEARGLEVEDNLQKGQSIFLGRDLLDETHRKFLGSKTE